MARGRYEKAVKFFRKVLVSKTQVLGLSHAAVAATLGRLAECEMLRCDYQVRAWPIWPLSRPLSILIQPLSVLLSVRLPGASRTYPGPCSHPCSHPFPPPSSPPPHLLPPNLLPTD